MMRMLPSEIDWPRSRTFCSRRNVSASIGIRQSRFGNDLTDSNFQRYCAIQHQRPQPGRAPKFVLGRNSTLVTQRARRLA
jgi:hypothetical protein